MFLWSTHERYIHSLYLHKTIVHVYTTYTADAYDKNLPLMFNNLDYCCDVRRNLCCKYFDCLGTETMINSIQENINVHAFWNNKRYQITTVWLQALCIIVHTIYGENFVPKCNLIVGNADSEITLMVNSWKQLPDDARSRASTAMGLT